MFLYAVMIAEQVYGRIKLSCEGSNGRQPERLILMEKRFELVDKRFEQVDKHFEQIDKQLEKLNQAIMDIHQEIKLQMRWSFGVLLGVGGLVAGILKLTG